MERLCFTFDLVPGTEEEYDRMHREIWPELAAAIVDSGYRDYTLFRRGSHVICTCICDPDVATVRQRMADGYSDITDRWNRVMEPYIARMTDDSGNLFEYAECWHLEEAKR